MKHSAINIELFEKGPVVVFVWKNESGWPVESVTGNLLEIFGYDPSCFVLGELQYAQKIHPEELSRVFAEVKAASNNLSCNAFVHQPYRFMDAFGKYRWVKDSSQIIRSQTGEITHYIGYLIDISDEVELYEETNILKERLNLAWNGINDGLWDWNIASGDVYFSPRYKEMLGYTNDEFSNDIDAFYKAIHPQDQALVHNLLQRHFADPTHVPYEIDMRIFCKNAEYKWIRSRGKTILNADGMPYRMVGAHTDIDENKKQIDALEVMHRRYKVIMENAPDGIYVMDTQGYVIECNQQAAQMLGYTVAEMQTLHVHDWDASLTKQELIELMKNVSTHPINFETKHQRKDGTTYDAAILAVKIQIADKDYMYASVRDISKQKETEKKLLEQHDELQKTQVKFQTLFEESHDGIVLMDPVTQTFVEFNQQACKMYGYTKEEFACLSPRKLDGFEDNAQMIATQEAIMKNGWHQFSTKHKTKTGKLKDVVVTVKVFVLEGKNVLHATFHDITQTTKQAQIIKKQNEEFKTIFDISRDGLAILDLESNFLDCNDAYLFMTGFSRSELLQTSCIALSIPQDYERAQKAMQITRETGYLESFEKTCIVKDGRHIIVRMALSLMPDKQRMMISVIDMTDFRSHEQELEYIAHFDTLTKLPNRALFSDRIKQSVANAHRNHQTIAVAYLDLDGFKQVNDTYGHDIGDFLLVELSQRMQKSLREGDTLARFGGDEFVAILSNQNNKEETFAVLNRLLHAASSSVEIANTLINVSASIGVTFYSKKDEVDADILIRQADQAMYEAKLRGKNQIAVFEEISEFLSLVSENALAIKNALKKSEFMLYYQPKVNMKSGNIMGVEALIRWNDPVRGIIYPDDFLPIVDNRPLMYEIDRWVFNEALAQLCCWYAQGIETKVSINISAYTFKQPDFFSLVDDALAKYPEMKPFMIDIEILESSSLHEINEVRQIIEKLHERKITVSLDDFGTGYSTLSYLKVLGVDTLKIDKSFVLDILQDLGDLSIVDASISLAQAFNAQPLAEGVESVAHGKLLIELGCQLAQGYVIARPMPAEMFPKWAAEWKSPQSWQDANKRD